ncbi:MAG: hypothetical protein GY801_41680, partial [bacterium]|nr:hypothetical protein [bacterium]
MSSDQLRDVLREETEAARTEALQSRGKISDDRLKTLENLDRLVEISDNLKAPKPHKRWPVAVILGACLLI